MYFSSPPHFVRDTRVFPSLGRGSKGEGNNKILKQVRYGDIDFLAIKQHMILHFLIKK